MNVSQIDDRNADQAAYWNGPAGQYWTDRQQIQDLILAPVSRILIDQAKITQDVRVIDVGCGCGATTIEIGKQLGPAGHVLGLDISAPMLARARELTPKNAPVEFILADATVHRFEPESFDLLVSRFGVMFFADPVASFSNLRTALKRGGRVVFACWREPRYNQWLMLPLKAAYKHVPKLPEMARQDPGPFAFAQEEWVQHILTSAGFTSVAMEAHDLHLDIAVGRGLEAAVQGTLEIGPASRALDGQPEHLRTAAVASIREALRPFLKDEKVPLAGSIWIVSATNP
ncbi:methyltransferase [Afipia sp. Root123D2]|uniref:class I SAM-dependent methyltransferase n=1 Tax=Afipia sp. Root123D2 TaxID=1736436 RepID=UPI0006FF1596|nr:class I SAM-dependent methyltransferase [Afipia sp. Root123D2]KQW18458.1 methyltransferase [Afipia sp. Root123D2]